MAKGLQGFLWAQHETVVRMELCIKKSSLFGISRVWYFCGTSLVSSFFSETTRDEIHNNLRAWELRLLPSR